MLRSIPIYFVLLTSVYSIQDELTNIERITLHASRTENIWFVTGTNDTGTVVNVPATVPGGIYSDLEENGVFDSRIYHDYNDLATKWVGRTNWTYSRKFTVSEALLLKEKIVLVCEGLDTVSEILVNGISVGQSRNMFVRYVFDIKAALKTGSNYITVAFQSPVFYAENEYHRHEKEQGYAVRPERLTDTFQGEDKVQFIRKMQSSFSWDWGVSYPSSGIWKSIYVEGYNTAVIRDVLIFTTPSKLVPDETSATNWTVTARVYYDSSREQSVVVSLQGSNSNNEVDVRLQPGEGLYVDVSIVEPGSNIKLWWPNGYGDQNLYWYKVTLTPTSSTESAARKVRVGFRTVELVQPFVDPTNERKGREFYFIINGMKIFAKGSNSIPLHVLPERITKHHTEWVLWSAKISYQNMIRVWGGGIYESDDFYDFADEYGILIMQDFMFACAQYPATPDFLENIRKEVTTQVKRLQAHTSLAIYCGNNEIEQGLTGGWFGSDNHYENDYKKLYIETMQTVTRQLDPSREYISSSPSNGVKTAALGGISSEFLSPSDALYGDTHAYDYSRDNWKWQSFSPSRFVSEYGYQSFPDFDTLAGVITNLSSWSQLDYRQRQFRGQHVLMLFVETHFPVTKGDKYETPEDLRALLYLIQLTQCMGQKTQTERYRRVMDKLNKQGSGHTMGALYWQLNDIWQGASWASVEVSGRWKLVMYFVKRFLAPVLASPYKNQQGDVIVELISDSINDYTGNLNVKIFKLGSENPVPVFEESRPVHANFLTSKEVFRIPKSTLQILQCDANEDSKIENPCIVYVTATDTPDNFLFLQYPLHPLSAPDPHLEIGSISAGKNNDNTISFTLRNKAIAPFVYLSVKGDEHGYFSDNGFIQITPKNITYYSQNGISVEYFLANFKSLSLFDAVSNPARPTRSDTYYNGDDQPVDNGYVYDDVY